MLSRLRRASRVVRLRPARPVLVAMLLAAGLTVATGAAGSPTKSGAHQTASATDRAQAMARDPYAARHRREARARERRLASPQARRTRHRSRTAYRNLSATRALAMLRRAAPQIATDPMPKAPSLGRGSRRERFLGDYAALLTDRAGRHAVVRSTVPLRAPRGKGRNAPVDMTLVRRSASFTPANSATPVSLPVRVRQGARLQRSGVGLVPRVSRNARARRIGHRLFYANVATDSDIVIAPTPFGVEVFTELRSVASQEEFGFGLRLPAGAVAGLDSDGQVVIERADQRLATIPAPAAWDADGRVVRTRYRLIGHELIVSVPHRGGDHHYPITVDPYAIEDNDFRSPHPAEASFTGWNPLIWRTSGNAMATAQSGAEGRGLYMYASPGWTIPANDYAAWIWKAPAGVNIFQADSFASTVPFYGYFNMKRGIVNDGPAWAPGSPAVEAGGATLRDSRRVQCASGATPSSTPSSPAPPVCAETSGTAANEFWIMYQAGYAVTVGGTANTYAYLSLAWLYMHDPTAPTVTVPPTEKNAGWRKDGVQVPAFTVQATDGGLGMTDINVRGGNVSLQSKPQCLGGRDWRCPLTAPIPGWDTTFTYNTNQLPEGLTTMTADSHDVAGNVGSTTWTAKVDKSEPGADTSGELDEVRDQPRLTTDSPTLTVYATDENDAGTVSSGVQSIEVLFDDTDPNPSTNFYKRPETSCDSCDLEHTFQLNTSTLVDGPHSVDVRTLDYAGNLNIETWEFTIDRTTPKPLCSDPSADPRGCAPDPPSTVAPACTTTAPVQQATGGAAVTVDQAIAQTQQTMPQALTVSDQVSLESLTAKPALTGTLLANTSTGTIMPSKTGSVSPTYTVGSATKAACVTPVATTPSATSGKLVNGTAVEYANTAPWTDTILRPTPLGMQEITQIRSSSAPEALQYQVALGAGQFLQKLESGEVAIIDPSVPTTSGSQPPPPSPGPAPGMPINPTDRADSGNIHADSDPDEEITGADTPDAVPEDQDISPASTESQYDSENAWQHWGEEESDGQAVALFIPPTAKDAFGNSVPTDLSISGTNVVVVTTRHRSGAEGYPVMSSRKTTTTSTGRVQKVTYQLDAQQPSGMTAARPATASSPEEGAPELIKGMNARQMRVIMTGPGSCDRFATASGADLRNAAWDGQPDSDRCKATVETILTALSLGLKPYVTFDVEDNTFQARPFAGSMKRLWRSYPFSQVKLWGTINEPDLEKVQIDKAVHTFREVQRAANREDPNTGHAWCRRCQIAAGEFAVNRPSTIQWTMDYIDRFSTTKGARPHFWAVHDYADITWQEWHPATKGYPVISHVSRRIKRKFGTRPRIWMSEQGVVVRRTSARDTAVNGRRDDQRMDGKRIFKLAAASNQISQVAYYELFGDPNQWDSALVEPVGPRANLEATTEFRPAYCAVGRRAVATCAGSTGLATP
jgi:hypothetical protein